MFVVQELSQEARKKAPQTLSLNPGIFVSKNDNSLYENLIFWKISKVVHFSYKLKVFLWELPRKTLRIWNLNQVPYTRKNGKSSAEFDFIIVEKM